jgi:ketosteroid isomerase-like protein
MSTEAPLAAMQQYIDGFNNGDANLMAATFADPATILDGMAPHVWHGPTATQDWYRDALTEGEHLGVSGDLIALGEPLHNDVTGDSAYVVVPATFAVQRPRRGRHSNWCVLHGGASQAQRRLAHSGVGLDKRQAVVTCSNSTTSSTSC